MRKLLLLMFLSLWFWGGLTKPSLAASGDNQTDQQTMDGKIDKIVEEKTITVMDTKQLYQKLEVTITSGEKKR